jgi:hypothetical protein
MAPVQLTCNLFIFNHDHHPHPDLLITADQRRAVDIARLGWRVDAASGEPVYFGGDSYAMDERIKDCVGNRGIRSDDSIDEFGLEQSRNSQSG